MRGILRSYVATWFGLATRRRRVQIFEELQGEAFWFGSVAGGMVTVTLDRDPLICLLKQSLKPLFKHLLKPSLKCSLNPH